MKTNHRRGGKTRIYPDYADRILANGTLPPEDKPWRYIEKSMHSWGRKGVLSGVAGIANDFTNGHRGMAKAVRGAKKFVRTRIRFHENTATRKLADEPPTDE
jgi:hypothetical protein